jgi:hypothetical protein
MILCLQQRHCVKMCSACCMRMSPGVPWDTCNTRCCAVLRRAALCFLISLQCCCVSCDARERCLPWSRGALSGAWRQHSSCAGTKAPQQAAAAHACGSRSSSRSVQSQNKAPCSQSGVDSHRGLGCRRCLVCPLLRQCACGRDKSKLLVECVLRHLCCVITPAAAAAAAAAAATCKVMRQQTGVGPWM